MLTASYGAEFGRSAGGQIRVVTKSGTAISTARHTNTSATTHWTRNLVAQPQPRDQFRARHKFNQFGFNVSGPIYIPKTSTQTGTRCSSPTPKSGPSGASTQTNNRTGPSARMKNGDFGELLTPSLWFSTPQIIKDPTTGSPFPGNVIPKARQSPNGWRCSTSTRCRTCVPLATPTGTAWRPRPRISARTRFGVDVLPGSKDNIRFRASLFHYLDVESVPDTFLFSSRTFDRPNQTVVDQLDAHLHPDLMMETTVAASRDQVFIRMTDTPAFDRTKYGINYPYILRRQGSSEQTAGTCIFRGSSEYTGSPYPSNSTGPIYTSTSNLTKIVNNHTFKFGFAFERAGPERLRPDQRAGRPRRHRQPERPFRVQQHASRRHRCGAGRRGPGPVQ